MAEWGARVTRRRKSEGCGHGCARNATAMRRGAEDAAVSGDTRSGWCLATFCCMEDGDRCKAAGVSGKVARDGRRGDSRGGRYLKYRPPWDPTSRSIGHVRLRSRIAKRSSSNSDATDRAVRVHGRGGRRELLASIGEGRLPARCGLSV
ncbi:hypothetical protein PVAP13_2KG363410 [Panicum virgatum]|uniref:Uncharacterized protein n=1 Tax=Panicum virgatum TaxID=38727 RepID=A0A8T0WGM2_PANVG|nr:hypothetical protein PVAP13_2KG363410 [Panicum virgatum]